jgi:hypothetical protein
MDAATRARISRRALNRCEYCRMPQEVIPFPLFHVEHICPRKHGGTSQEENLGLACSFCNLHKASNLTGIDPETGQITPLFNPRVEQWADHFSYEAGKVIGVTKTGRVTVRVLNMNDPERVELRLAAVSDSGAFDR